MTQNNIDEILTDLTLNLRGTIHVKKAKRQLYDLIMKEMPRKKNEIFVGEGRSLLYEKQNDFNQALQRVKNMLGRIFGETK